MHAHLYPFFSYLINIYLRYILKKKIDKYRWTCTNVRTEVPTVCIPGATGDKGLKKKNRVFVGRVE